MFARVLLRPTQHVEDRTHCCAFLSRHNPQSCSAPCNTRRRHMPSHAQPASGCSTSVRVLLCPINQAGCNHLQAGTALTGATASTQDGPSDTQNIDATSPQPPAVSHTATAGASSSAQAPALPVPPVHQSLLRAGMLRDIWTPEDDTPRSCSEDAMAPSRRASSQGLSGFDDDELQAPDMTPR